MSTITAQLGVASESVAAPTLSTAVYAAGPPATLTLTFASAHNLVAHRSWVTLAGFTPTGYNGLRVPVTAVTSATIAVVMLPSAIGAVTVAGNATVQTPGTVASTGQRFFIPRNVGLTRGEYPRLVSEGIRAGTRTRSRSDVVPYKGGVGGPASFDVRDRGFGFWWARIMGGAVTTTALGGVPPAFRHAWELGNLNGDAFTAQVNRPFRSGIARPSTFVGCKVASATIGLSRNGLLSLEVDMVGIDEDDTVAMWTASYPAGALPVSFCGGSLTLDGVAVPVLDWEVTIDSGLETDTSRLRGDCTQMEHLSEGSVEVTWKATADWRDYRFRDKYAAVTSAGVIGDIELSAQWPVAISGGNFPRLALRMPAAEIDGGDPTIGGVELLTQSLEGVATDPETGTGTALRLEYTTADALP
jgi:hypothetical protein